MHSAVLHSKLIQEGYVLVPQVLTAVEVRSLRSFCKDYCARTGRDIVYGREFLNIPQLARIPFLQTIIEALKTALKSDYIVVPEFNMQAGKWGGWHFDSSALNDAAWLYDPDYLQVECAIYLQDAHPVYAGGLELTPRSHRLPFAPVKPGSLFNRVAKRLNHALRRSISVPSRAGDLIIWDFRLFHRGLAPRTETVPEEFTKYGIFFGAATTQRHARLYMQNMKNRGDSGELFYKDIAALKFPDSYPEDIVTIVSANHLGIASF